MQQPVNAAIQGLAAEVHNRLVHGALRRGTALHEAQARYDAVYREEIRQDIHPLLITLALYQDVAARA